MPVNKARLVAQLLFKRFLADGALAAIPYSLASADEGFQLAAAKRRPDLWEETHAFAGLAVQGVGYEEGKEKPGVVVYVTKGAARELRRFPKEIDGVPIEVRKIGLVSIRPEQTKPGKATREPNIYVRKKRIGCGGSCATGSGDAGTFGAIVAREDDGSLFMLSNNHVLASCNHIPPGMPIMAPASDDSRPGAWHPESIAELAEVIPLRSGDFRHVAPCEEDVALGLILKPDSVTSWQGDAEGYDTPTAVADPVSGMRVKKIGRTTGLTEGVIHTAAGEPIPIPCNGRHFKGTVWYANAWYVLGSDSPFALPGDSGSLVVTRDGKTAVGLLFS
jgi:hypothetical protein